MPVSPEAQAQLPAGVTGVDAIDAPGGGQWVLGADGGVFAIGGAPFFGSVPGLAPEQRQGERTFVRIERDASGGYTLVSNRGETYNFAGPPGQAAPIAPPPPPVAPPPPGLTEEEKSAKATLNNILSEAGLSGLGDWLWGRFLEVGQGQALLDLRDRPEYAQRFPAMKALRDKGRAISESEYIAYERTATQLMRQHGLPEGFYDQPEDFSNLLGAEVSASELGERIQLASQAAFRAPVETRLELQRLYGVTPGGLTAFFLDPDRATPLLERTALAAEVGGAARRTGFGLITASEAERLVELGISQEEAASGFGQLIRSQELFQALPGGAGADITREEQIGAVFEGNVAEQERIARRQRQRQATFGGGGQFVAGQEGVSGLGGG